MPNLTAASITSTGTTATRTLGARFSDVLNVKDFGAVGNGVANDTAAVQACFDAAFGTYASPHGGLNGTLNKAVYFPNGVYLVTPSITARAVTGTTNVGGLVRITTSSTTPLVNGDMVYIRGVTGTTFANGSFEVSNVTATTFDLVASQHNGAYVSGGTWCPPCLKVRSVHGGRIIGTGMASSALTTNTPNCALISTNGMQYSYIEGMSFSCNTGGIAFDLNLGTVANSCNLQSNTFTKCWFAGGSTRPDYGCAVGFGMTMGSENTWFWCNFSGCDIAGLYIHNQNSLDNTVFGGNQAANKVGILVNSGSCPWIHGISFQNYADPTWWDIVINGSQGDAYSIAGCRSESYRFLYAPVASDQLTIHISGCSHLAGINVNSIFYRGNASTTIEGCRAVGGYVGGDGKLTILNAHGFLNPNYLTDDAVSHNYRFLDVSPQRVITETGSRSMASADGSAKIRFNSASAQTYTVVKNSDATCRLDVGSQVFLQQVGAGRLTVAPASGVTINSSLGLKARVQYSCATLTCDGADLWTLTGDTSVA